MGGFAWVTLATNDSYSLGALVLAHSLRRVGTKHDLAVLVTPGVTGAMREKLSTVFSLVQEVNVLDSKDEANLALLARPELGITFTKLHCWRLTQYEKCVFVDADTLVIRNCDELFDREELSAAPDVGWPDCFNSGVFVFKPSQQTFASITSFAAAKGSFDGGDQGLLNQYFSDWAHKDISKHLPFIYNMCSTATYSYLPAFKQFGEDVRIIHFIGITKPWLQYFDTLTGQVQPAPGTNHLQPLLQLWWNIFCENVHPQLTPVMASSTLAQHWHEYNSNSSFSQEPKILTHEPSDTGNFTYDIITVEPDFSEFTDPWENYSQRTNFTDLPSSEPANRDNCNDSSNSSNREYVKKNDFYPFVSSNSPNYHHSDSKNYRSDWSYRGDDHAGPSVLKNIENNERQDDRQIFYPREIDNSRSNIENNYFHVSEDNQDNRVKNTCTSNWISCSEGDSENYENDKPNKFTKIDQQQLDHSFEINNRKIGEIVHQDEEKQQNYHHPHWHHHHHHHHQCREIERQSENTNIHREHVVSTILLKNISINETKCNNNGDKLRDHCVINFSERQTDKSDKTSHSHPSPCTKSKSVTTQSESNITRQLESNDAGIAGALAKITLGEARSLEQIAFEEHMRKQSWEQGQIDYMGRDSFENIWKKISETLGMSAERQSSPPKIVPKPKTSELEEAGSAAVEPAAKSGAAVPSEPQQKDEQDPIVEIAHDVRKVIPPLSELTAGEICEETVSSSLSEDAALTTVAPVSTVTELSTLESLESSSNKKDDLPKTISEDSSIAQQTAPESQEQIRKINEDEGKNLESQEVLRVEPIIPSSAVVSAEILSESQVPIQVAETVLEADVKESVTEDIGPVTEEAISLISVIARESVPAVLETAMEALEPIESTAVSVSADLRSEIGNGIDALSLSSPTELTSVTVATVQESLDVVLSVQTEDSPAPILTETPRESTGQEVVSPAATESVQVVQDSALLTEVQTTPSELPDKPQESKIPEETEQSISSLVEPAQEELKLSEETQRIEPTLIKPAEDSKSPEETQQVGPAPVESMEKPQEPPTESKQSGSTSIKPAEESGDSKSSEETQRVVQTPVESTEEPREPRTEVEQSDPPMMKIAEEPKDPQLSLETQKIDPPPVDSTEKPVKPVDKSQESEKSVDKPRESDKPVEKLQEPEKPVEKLQESEKPVEKTDQKSKILETHQTALSSIESVVKSEEPATSTETNISKVSTLKSIEKPELTDLATKPEEPAISCPVKPARKVEEPPAKTETPSIPLDPSISESRADLPIEKGVSKEIEAEIEASEEMTSESSEESPIRPARTKDLQIPETPTIIEATPPTSPPIGGAESLEDQQQTTKVTTTKKIVKKVVKKTSETKPAEATEPENADGKKVTKKVVKKVVKKKEDDAGNNGDSASGGNDKPKKIVKVVKKMTKTTSQTLLDAEATVPDTPPPGTSEIPVPPKRKLKTTAKTTTQKSDSEA